MYKSVLIFYLFFSEVTAQSSVTILIDKIESWSDPEYVIVTFDLKKGPPGHELNYVIDNSFNFTRKITNLYSHMTMVSNDLDKLDQPPRKLLDSMTDMCKLFEGKARDLYLNFMFSVVYPAFGKPIKKCPIKENSVYTYVNITVQNAPIPFGKYLVSEFNSYTNWMYKVKEHKKYKMIMNVSIYTKLRYKRT